MGVILVEILLYAESIVCIHHGDSGFLRYQGMHIINTKAFLIDETQNVTPDGGEGSVSATIQRREQEREFGVEELEERTELAIIQRTPSC